MAETTETELKYYFAGSVRIAVRENGTLTWLLADHLGSTNVTADTAGNLLTSLKYTAFGEIRSGDSSTDYQYTGQRNEAEIGLYYYIARYYDPELGRFISADTIIPEPGSSQAYDRYAYVNNNPINNNDPSGHRPCDNFDGNGCYGGGNSSPGEEWEDYVYNVLYNDPLAREETTQLIETVLDTITQTVLSFVAPPVGLFLSDRKQ